MYSAFIISLSKLGIFVADGFHTTSSVVSASQIPPTSIVIIVNLLLIYLSKLGNLKPASQGSHHKAYICTWFTTTAVCFFPSFFSHPIYYLRPFISLSLLVVTEIRDHIAGSSPPSSLRFVPCPFIARRVEHFLPATSTCVEVLSC